MGYIRWLGNLTSQKPGIWLALFWLDFWAKTKPIKFRVFGWSDCQVVLCNPSASGHIYLHDYFQIFPYFIWFYIAIFWNQPAEPSATLGMQDGWHPWVPLHMTWVTHVSATPCTTHVSAALHMTHAGTVPHTTWVGTAPCMTRAGAVPRTTWAGAAQSAEMGSMRHNVIGRWCDNDRQKSHI